jgi:PEGA domain-containing protein
MLRPPFEVPLTLAAEEEVDDHALELFSDEEAPTSKRASPAGVEHFSYQPSESYQPNDSHQPGDLDFDGAQPFAGSLGPSRWLVWALLGTPAVLFLVAWFVMSSGSGRRAAIEGAERLRSAIHGLLGGEPTKVPAARPPAAPEGQVPAAPAAAVGTAPNTFQSTVQPANTLESTVQPANTLESTIQPAAQPEAGSSSVPASRTDRSASALTSAASKSRPASPAARDPLAGTLSIDSRPIGASVYIDEQLLGTTPMTLPQISPGAHSLRLHLAAHRDWMSKVQIDPDARNRVTAGLEEDENVQGR